MDSLETISRRETAKGVTEDEPHSKQDGTCLALLPAITWLPVSLVPSHQGEQ